MPNERFVTNNRRRRQRMAARGLKDYSVVAHQHDIEAIRAYAAGLLRIRVNLALDKPAGAPSAS